MTIEGRFGTPAMTATGVDGLIHVALRCQDDNQVARTITLLGSGGRRNGGAEVEWDDRAYSRPGGASPLCGPRDVGDVGGEACRRWSGDDSGPAGVAAGRTLDGPRR